MHRMLSWKAADTELGRQAGQNVFSPGVYDPDVNFEASRTSWYVLEPLPKNYLSLLSKIIISWHRIKSSRIFDLFLAVKGCSLLIRVI